MGSMPQEPACSEFVEVDPTGRYGRYNDVLGKGASKTVYRAFDEYEGIEVAWNQVKLYDFLQSPEGLERLYCEIHLLKTLRHKNIMKFYTSWVDTTNRNINFITEMFASGTLRQYRQKHRRVNIRAVKHWCRQILSGLLYLHSHDPPVIHRDLKCDNIFINGNQGEVKIGDLGLAAFLRKSHAAHCVGTPEFMAPEVYEEEYNELVDIYSFGMCVLEMVTFEYPYSECTHHAQIYKKVVSGTKPEALYKVKDPEVRHFVEKCLVTASQRLPAKELLKDPFLQTDDYYPASGEVDVREVEPLVWQPSCSSHLNNEPIQNGFSNCIPYMENGWDNNQIDFEPSGIELFNCQEDESFPNMDITIKGRKREDGSIYLRLRITDKEGRTRNIYFAFDIEGDTAMSVASEMVSELDIIDYDVTRIAEMIDGEISSLVPGWEPGPGIEDSPGYPRSGICQDCTSNVSPVGSFLDYVPGCNNLLGLHCSQLGCAAMHGRFEEISYQVDGSEQCETEGAQLPSSSSEGIDLFLPSSPESHSDDEMEHMDVPARYVNWMHESSNHVQSIGRKRFDPLCCGSINQQCLEISKASYRPPRNMSKHYENEIQQELRWHKVKHQLKVQHYKNQPLEGSWRTLDLPSVADYREDRRKDGGAVSSLRPSKICTTDALKSLHLGEKYSLHHPQVCNIEATSKVVSTSANRNGGFYWASCLNSESPSARHCKVKHERSPETMFSVKDFYEGVLLLSCVPRTKTLPVDSVDA